jgi:Protein of unknown function (DUF2829)
VSLVNFGEALALAQAGTPVRRSVWRTDKGMFALAQLSVESVPVIGAVLLIRHPGTGRPARLFAGSQWDILAQDWETAAP